MPTVDQAVDEFLALKRIAVAGVSRSPGGSHASKDIPDGVDGVVIATNPSVSLSVAQECKELGIDKVWIHKNIGAGSYTTEAHDYCRENGITALVSCPLWYGKTSDGFHRFFGATCRLFRRVPNEV